MPKLRLFTTLIIADQITKAMVAGITNQKIGTRLIGIDVHCNSKHISIVALALLIGLHGMLLLVKKPNWYTVSPSISSLILAGASSNMVEYLHKGMVVDWISIRGILVLNLADIYILLGIASVICSIGTGYFRIISVHDDLHGARER